jgi:hypothetical protein
MKISHTELESCLKGPRRWLKEKAAASSSYFNFGYNRALLLSIYNFHKTNQAGVARKYLRDIIQRHKFKDFSRIHEIEARLDAYIDWCDAENIAVADSHVLIRLDSGQLSLVGEVSRVDVMPDSYRAVLLGAFDAHWRRQLRMPLLQRAISDKFARPIKEVTVGVQQLDGSCLEVHSYSKAALDRAERRFKRLSRKLQRYAIKSKVVAP